jgi:hypothetical protein
MTMTYETMIPGSALLIVHQSAKVSTKVFISRLHDATDACNTNSSEKNCFYPLNFYFLRKETINGHVTMCITEQQFNQMHKLQEGFCREPHKASCRPGGRGCVGDLPTCIMLYRILPVLKVCSPFHKLPNSANKPLHGNHC